MARKGIKREPVSVTFVLQRDFTANVADIPPQNCIRMIRAMKEAMDFVGLKEYDIIALDTKTYYEAMKEKGIPELWYHDVGADRIGPHLNYYVIKFDDGSSKAVMLFPAEEKRPAAEVPMFS